MERLIAIIGPTGVGKTKISIELAKLLKTEIISGDSMLIYRDFNIGTAKPSLEEQAGIKHHLIDILDCNSNYNVVDFQKQAGELITAINSDNKIPILAGGTGLYVKALLEGYNFNTVTGNEEIRTEFAKLAESRGSTYLHTLLAERSPQTAARLHPNDLRRVIRALEIHEQSGEAVSQQKKGCNSIVYDAEVIGLTMEREALYRRINQRVDSMVAAGLIDEVKDLLARGCPPDCQAMQGIGYKETLAYLRGETDLLTMIETIKKVTRNFAKRQQTWFRKMQYIHWLNIDHFNNNNDILAYINNRVAGKFRLG